MNRKVSSEEGIDGTGLREDQRTHFPANFLFLYETENVWNWWLLQHLSNCFQCAKLEWAFQFEKRDLKKKESQGEKYDYKIGKIFM